MNGRSLQELRSRAAAWLAEDPDAVTQQELQRLLDREEETELRDRFDSKLEFGTAGLRGVLGAGPNRMNRAVVLRTTAGLCRWLLRRHGDARGSHSIAIGYDGRRRSRDFAEDAASVCAGLGLRAWLFPKPMPTPVLAFATVHLGCVAGVMVTASHNPPEYNGFKVYLANGAQLIAPSDQEISSSIDEVGSLLSLARPILKECRARGLLMDLPPETTEAYLSAVLGLRRRPLTPEQKRPVIAYTPLHGVGWGTTREALSRAGFDALHVVEAQAEPDGEFPTVRFPNPEEPGAMDLVLALAKERSADLVLANDPDADRLAVAIPAGEGRFQQLTGNEVGALLGAYLLEGLPATKPTPLTVTSLVSSPMLGAIAGALGVRYEEVLTGFKWIANRALALEASGEFRFVFGYEEALGYSVGTVVRDKDGVSAALLMAELSAWCASQGRSVAEELQRLQRRYGLFVSGQHNVTLLGSEGAARLQSTMRKLREAPPVSLDGAALESIADLLAGTRSNIATGERVSLEMPPSNVLVWHLAGGARVTARPSGTEPKLKVYFDLRETVGPAETIEVARARAEGRLASLRAATVTLLEGHLGS